MKYTREEGINLARRIGASICARDPLGYRCSALAATKDHQRSYFSDACPAEFPENKKSCPSSLKTMKILTRINVDGYPIGEFAGYVTDRAGKGLHGMCSSSNEGWAKSGLSADMARHALPVLAADEFAFGRTNPLRVQAAVNNMINWGFTLLPANTNVVRLMEEGRTVAEICDGYAVDPVRAAMFAPGNLTAIVDLSPQGRRPVFETFGLG